MRHKGSGMPENGKAGEAMTTCWKMTDGVWALYTDSGTIREMAGRLGLRRMGVYYGRDGRIRAWQFAGDRKAVTACAKLAREG